MQEEPLQIGERLHGERLRRAFDRHIAIKAKQAQGFQEWQRKNAALPARASPLLPAPGRRTTPSTTAPADRLPYSDSFGSFFGPSHKVVSDRMIELVREQKKRKASGSPQKQPSVLDRGMKGKAKRKTVTKPESARKKPKFSRIDYSFLRTEEDPTDATPSPKQDQGEFFLAKSTRTKEAKQRFIKEKEKKASTSRGATIQVKNTPIETSKRTHSTLKETRPFQVGTRKDLSIRETPTTLAPVKRESSSTTQNVKGKKENKDLLTRKVNSCDNKNVKDKKLSATFEGQNYSKQSTSSKRKSNDTKIHELEDDLEDIETTKIVGVKSNSKKQRRRCNVVSDSDDDYEDFGNVRAKIHAAMGYNAKKYIGRDDKDDKDMEADFETIEREEKISERIAKKEDERELALITREEKEARARKRRGKRF